MSNTLFYIFAFVTVLAAIMVITVVNPVHSVLFLVLVFLNAAGMLFVLQLEFIPLTFIIVYVGAIAILFLFVVMMLDIKVTSKSNDFFMKISMNHALRVMLINFRCRDAKGHLKEIYTHFTCATDTTNIQVTET